MVIDAVRCAKLASTAAWPARWSAPSRYFMKSPPRADPRRRRPQPRRGLHPRRGQRDAGRHREAGAGASCGGQGEGRYHRQTEPLARRQRHGGRAPGEPQRASGDASSHLWAYRARRVAHQLAAARLALPLAAAAGNVAFDVAGGKRAVVRANLSRPMRLPEDHPRVRRAARRAFRNYAKYLVDMMRLGDDDRPTQAAKLVEIENLEILRGRVAAREGVLLCTVHVGGMDLHRAGAATSLGESLHVVADDTTYGRLYDHLHALRARHSIFLIGWRNLRGLFKVLRGGGNLVLFCDGGYRRGDVPVEFCGEPTTFPAGPATIAARSGAPILPVWCRRTADDRFEALGLPLIRPPAATRPRSSAPRRSSPTRSAPGSPRTRTSGTCSAPSGRRPMPTAHTLPLLSRRRAAATTGPGCPRPPRPDAAGRRAADSRVARVGAARRVAYGLADIAGAIWYRSPASRRLVAANLARVCAATGAPPAG